MALFNNYYNHSAKYSEGPKPSNGNILMCRIFVHSGRLQHRRRKRAGMGNISADIEMGCS